MPDPLAFSLHTLPRHAWSPAPWGLALLAPSDESHEFACSHSLASSTAAAALKQQQQPPPVLQSYPLFARPVPRSSAFRSLTAPALPSLSASPSSPSSMALDNAPGSPPGLSSRSSNNSSSLASSTSCRGDDLSDMSNFEDVSLADGHRDWPSPTPHSRALPPARKTRPLAQPTQATRGPRAVKSTSNLREVSNGLRTSVTNSNHIRSHGGRRSPVHPAAAGDALSPRDLQGPASAPPVRRSLSPTRRDPRSPPMPRGPRMQRANTEVPIPYRPRRPSASQRPRKTAAELEAEYHDDSDDDLPEDYMVSNIPISPRPNGDRSGATSPHNPASGRQSPRIGAGAVVGIGVGAEMGRPRSWDEVMSDLSADARELTLKLEDHALTLPRRNSADAAAAAASKRPAMTKSQTMSTPPVQRGNYMIDPLPASKEKEKHLARTRPAWLPPKNPKEEKKHLKEYQKMVSDFLESEKRKSADADKTAQLSKRNSKDVEAALRAWRHILGDWDNEIHKRNTREMWWQGVPAALRGQVWGRAVGNDLQLSAASFKAALARARAAEERLSGTDRQHASARPRGGAGHARNVSVAESRADQRARRSLRALDADIDAGAFPAMGLFQDGQLRHRPLRDLLLAYAAYREDTGHVRGTAGVAALLLLQFMPTTPAAAAAPARIDEERADGVSSSASASPSASASASAPASPADKRLSTAEDAATASAFVLLANLLNRPLSLALCINDAGTKARAFGHIRKAMRAKTPRLEQHLAALAGEAAAPSSPSAQQPPPPSPAADGAEDPRLTWHDVLAPLCQSLLTSHLHAADAARAWDVLVFEGDGVLVRGAVAALARLEPELYGSAAEVRAALGPGAPDDDARRRLPELGDDGVEWLRWAGREDGAMPARRR